MKNAFTGWRYLWKSQDIRRKLIITLILLVIFRVAANIPVPGINGTALKSLLQGASGSGSFFAFLDLLSGGTISNFSILAMGVYPYITAQIILQLLTPIFPALQRKMEEDPREGRKWQEKWTYYLAVPMAALSALGQINLFNSYSIQGGQGQIVPFGFTGDLWLPSLTLLLAMVGGTMFAIWLGELISEYGIRGQGLSLIIFAGIVARMPAGFAGLLADKQHGWILVISMVVVMVAVIYAIVFVQQGRRYRTGNVSWPAGRQPYVHAGEGNPAFDGEPGGHDSTHLCQCHPAVSIHHCQLLCQFNQCCRCKICHSNSDHLQRKWLDLLSFILPDGRKFYFLLYRRNVLPAELWREFEEGRSANPGCEPRGSHPEIPYQGAATYYTYRVRFSWELLPCSDISLTWS